VSFVPRRLSTRESRTAIVTIALWLPAIAVDAQVVQEPQASREQRADVEELRPVVMLFDDNPSLRVGRHVRFDFHVKSQAEWRGSSDSASSSGDAFDLQRARIGIDGRVTRFVSYQVEREMRETKTPWRDVFVSVRPLRPVQIRLGRFKMPFSLEQTTGSMDGSFAYRSLAATYLAPSRDVGAMVRGEWQGNRLQYEAGVFREGGENAPANDVVGPVSERTVAGRVVSRPWRSKRVPPLRELEVGAAFTAGQVPEGLNSLRVETFAGDRIVDRVYVNGFRRRLGAEVLWRPGPASLQAEMIRVSDQRRGQGIDNEDLPDVVLDGWYLSGTWLITGEEKKDTVEPAAPLLQGGFGALEVAGRVEALGFSGGPAHETPSPGPRARRVPDTDVGAWTVGLNWYVNRFVRVQANLIRERQEEEGAILSTPGGPWSRSLRVQFRM
jgi:phosphate-selective porin OprO/OprP